MRLGSLVAWSIIAVTSGVGVFPSRPVSAQTTTRAQPADTAILEARGRISPSSAARGAASFDLAALRKLPSTTIRTSTQWTQGVKTFEGVSGAAFLKAVGGSGREVVAVALNDYRVTIPIEDFVQDRLIIAYALDGQPMSVRDKGPLWIMYPFDSSDEFRTEAYRSRAIWQLRTLEFR